MNLNKSLKKNQEKNQKSLLNPIRATLSDRIRKLKHGFEDAFNLIESSVGKTDDLSIFYRLEAQRLKDASSEELATSPTINALREYSDQNVLKNNNNYLNDSFGPIPAGMYIVDNRKFRRFISSPRRKNARKIMDIIISLNNIVLANSAERLYSDDGKLIGLDFDEDTVNDLLKRGIYPSQEWIASKAGCCVKTVNSWISRFRNMGMISTYRNFWGVSCYRPSNYFYSNDMIQILGPYLPSLYELAAKSYDQRTYVLRKIIKSSLHSDLIKSNKLRKFFKIKKKIELEKNRKYIFNAFKRKFNYFPQSTASTEDVLAHYRFHGGATSKKTVKHCESLKEKSSCKTRTPHISRRNAPSDMNTSKIPDNIMNIEEHLKKSNDFMKQMGWA